MKRKVIIELRELGTVGLCEKLKILKEEQFNLRFQTQLGEVSNPLRMRLVRRDIARIYTFINEIEKRKLVGEKK